MRLQSAVAVAAASTCYQQGREEKRVKHKEADDGDVEYSVGEWKLAHARTRTLNYWHSALKLDKTFGRVCRLFRYLNVQICSFESQVYSYDGLAGD